MLMRFVFVCQVIAALALASLTLGVAVKDTRHLESIVLQPEIAIEHRLSVMETDIKTIKEDLTSIKTLGYGVIGAFILQLVGTLTQVRRRGQT